MTGPLLVDALLEFQVQISGLKMKAEFIKIFKFEELGEAGECATLTISSKGGTSSIKLLLQSPLSLPTTTSWPTTLPPASGKRRRHRGAAAAARPVADKELLTTASQPLGEVFVCSSSSCSRRGS